MDALSINYRLNRIVDQETKVPEWVVYNTLDILEPEFDITRRKELKSFLINIQNFLNVESSQSSFEDLRNEVLWFIDQYKYFDDYENTYIIYDMRELTWLGGKKYDGDLSKGQRHGIGTLKIVIKSKYEKAISKIDIFSNEGILLSMSIPNTKRDFCTSAYRPFFFSDYDEIPLAYMYQGQWKNDIKDGKGEETWPDGSYYKGSYSNNTRNGFGEYYSNDGEVYMGNWKNGQKDGLGEIRWPDGSWYKGQFVNGVMEGEGNYYHRDGSIYIGQWKAGKIIFGNGKVVYSVTKSNRDSLQNPQNFENNQNQQSSLDKPSADMSNSDWLCNFLSIDDNDEDNDKVHSSSQFYDSAQLVKKSRIEKFEIHESKQISNVFEQEEFFTKPLSAEWTNEIGENKEIQGLNNCCYVRVVYLNGDKYSGLWKNGLKHGIGTYNFINGDEYKGFWNEGNKEEFGCMKYNDGEKYIGEWQDNQQCGIGKYNWPDGDVYEGEMKNSKAEGYGIMTYADRDKYYGQWKIGYKNGIGKYIWNDSSEYIGWYLDGEPSGIGKTTYTNYDNYIGEWKQGCKDGKGMYVWANGKTYKGDWDNDIQEGFGTIIYPDGKTYKGRWKAGKPNNAC